MLDLKFEYSNEDDRIEIEIELLPQYDKAQIVFRLFPSGTLNREVTFEFDVKHLQAAITLARYALKSDLRRAIGIFLVDADFPFCFEGTTSF